VTPENPVFTNCSIEIAGIPIRTFRKENDGRKWRVKTEARYLLFTKLGSYANADGSSCYPSARKLADVTGWSLRKVRYILAELNAMGLAVRTGRNGQHGAAIRALVPPTEVQDSHSEDARLESESAGLENLRVQDSHSHSAGLDSQSAGFAPESATMVAPNPIPERPALTRALRVQDSNSNPAGKAGALTTFEKAIVRIQKEARGILSEIDDSLLNELFEEWAEQVTDDLTNDHFESRFFNSESLVEYVRNTIQYRHETELAASAKRTGE